MGFCLLKSRTQKSNNIDSIFTKKEKKKLCVYFSGMTYESRYYTTMSDELMREKVEILYLY